MLEELARSHGFVDVRYEDGEFVAVLGRNVGAPMRSAEAAIDSAIAVAMEGVCRES